MPTISSSATITVADGELVTETAEVLVLPIAAPGEGRGRLVHPTLGAFDYVDPPDRWTNLRAGVIVPPVWTPATTLAGEVLTLWPGTVAGVVVEEAWTDSYAMDADQLDLLLAIFQAPPDPAEGYVELWPSYDTTEGYYVAFVGLEVGGQDVTLTPLSRAGTDAIEGPVVARFRVVSRID